MLIMAVLMLALSSCYQSSIIISRESKVYCCNIDMNKWNLTNCNQITNTMGNPVLFIRDLKMQIYFVDYLKNDFVEFSYLIKYQLNDINASNCSYTITNKTLIYKGRHIISITKDSYDNIYFAEKEGIIGVNY